MSFSDNLRGFPASCEILFPILSCDGNSQPQNISLPTTEMKVFASKYVYADILASGHEMVHFITPGHISYNESLLCYYHYYD